VIPPQIGVWREEREIRAFGKTAARNPVYTVRQDQKPDRSSRDGVVLQSIHYCGLRINLALAAWWGGQIVEDIIG